MKYWHMQMHPDDRSFADKHVYSVLEHKKIIREWHGRVVKSFEKRGLVVSV